MHGKDRQVLPEWSGLSTPNNRLVVVSKAGVEPSKTPGERRVTLDHTWNKGMATKVEARGVRIYWGRNRPGLGGFTIMPASTSTSYGSSISHHLHAIKGILQNVGYV